MIYVEVRNPSATCALGLLLLAAACTPPNMQPHGGQSFALVNPSFMSWSVQPEVPDLTGEHMLCDPAKVGYCPFNMDP